MSFEDEINEIVAAGMGPAISPERVRAHMLMLSWTFQSRQEAWGYLAEHPELIPAWRRYWREKRQIVVRSPYWTLGDMTPDERGAVFRRLRLARRA